MPTKIFPLLHKSGKPQDQALISRGAKDTKEGEIIDHGAFDKLSYEIYRRGIIKISDELGHVFKKDINIFETEVLKIDFAGMTEGQKIMINGSGDNDHLVFSRVNGDVSIELHKREFAAIEKLRGILASGKEKILGTKK
jgi:hypothetical protein